MPWCTDWRHDDECAHEWPIGDATVVVVATPCDTVRLHVEGILDPARVEEFTAALTAATALIDKHMGDIDCSDHDHG
jgi:hypothetical protein